MSERELLYEAVTDAIRLGACGVLFVIAAALEALWA